MKKISLLILSSFVSALLWSAAPTAYAKNHREKDKIKIYYSESIGAGDKVYHLTGCQKTRSYSPLKCNNYNASVYEDQCKPKKKVLEGQVIKGCILDSQPVPPPPYPAVNAQGAKKTKAQGGCSDDDEKLGILYAPEFAVVTNDGFEMKGKIAWNGDSVPPDLIKSVSGETESSAIPLYRPTLCYVIDVFAKRQSDGKSAEIQGSPDREELKFIDEEIRPISKQLIDNGCNNDNSQSQFNPQSTPYNDVPAVSCSIKERIVGSSGSDIFGQYIGALYKWASGIVGVIAVLTMVYSGIQISMAGGDSAKLDSAKQRIMQSLIGMALLFLSGLILYTINPGFFTG